MATAGEVTSTDVFRDVLAHLAKKYPAYNFETLLLPLVAEGVINTHEMNLVLADKIYGRLRLFLEFLPLKSLEKIKKSFDVLRCSFENEESFLHGQQNILEGQWIEQMEKKVADATADFHYRLEIQMKTLGCLGDIHSKKLSDLMDTLEDVKNRQTQMADSVEKLVSLVTHNPTIPVAHSATTFENDDPAETSAIKAKVAKQNVCVFYCTGAACIFTIALMFLAYARDQPQMTELVEKLVSNMVVDDPTNSQTHSEHSIEIDGQTDDAKPKIAEQDVGTQNNFLNLDGVTAFVQSLFLPQSPVQFEAFLRAIDSAVRPIHSTYLTLQIAYSYINELIEVALQVLSTLGGQQNILDGPLGEKMSKTVADVAGVPDCQQIDYVKALFDYDAEREDELSLQKGDIIVVVSKEADDGWWLGELNGKRGVFPNNFISVISSEEAEKLMKSKTTEMAQPGVSTAAVPKQGQ